MQTNIRNKLNPASKFLFRGQDIQTGELVYGSLFDHKGYYPEIITMHPDADGKAVYDRVCVNPATLAIWTGVSDCKSRRVFTGDEITIRIGRCRNDDGSFGWETEYNSKVGDISTAFQIDLPKGSDFDSTSILWLNEHAYNDFEIELIKKF